MEELAKCAADPKYFINTYCKVPNPHLGITPLILRDYQEQLIDSWHANDRNISLLPRQSGKSTCQIAYGLWTALFKPDQIVAIGTMSIAASICMMQSMFFMIDHLPYPIKDEILSKTKHSVAFANGSHIINQSVTEFFGRGTSVSLLILDEFAYVKPSTSYEWWKSILPCISHGQKCIMASSDNGNRSGQFGEIWKQATSEMTRCGFNAIGMNSLAKLRQLKGIT
jgi:hypothetical protein